MHFTLLTSSLAKLYGNRGILKGKEITDIRNMEQQEMHIFFFKSRSTHAHSTLERTAFEVHTHTDTHIFSSKLQIFS